MSEQESEGDEWLEDPPTVRLQHRPKDPRSQGKAKYNVFSRLLFLWIEPLFWRGYRHGLSQEDLYAHPGEADSKKMLTLFNRYWSVEETCKKQGQSSRLWLAVIKSIWWRFSLAGLLHLIDMSLVLVQSVVLGNLIDYFSIEVPTKEDTRNAYLYTAALTVQIGLTILVHTHAFFVAQKTGMMVRIILTTAIYQKVLLLNEATIGKVSIGHVINLASNDVHKMDLALMYCHYLWIGPFFVLPMFTYLAYQEVGWSVFMVTGFVIILVPLLYLFSRIFSHFRFKSSRVTDTRVRIMNEIITGIRVIKMYAWEYAFKRVVSKLRRKETNRVLYGGMLYSFAITFSQGASVPFMTAIMFLPYAATGGILTPRNVFKSLFLLIILAKGSVYFVVQGLFFVSEARVSLRRIQRFLEIENFDSCTKQRNSTGKSHKYHESHPRSDLDMSNHAQSTPTDKQQDIERHVCVTLSCVSAAYTHARDKMVLNNITFNIDKGNSHLAIVGPVGAGKTTLLQLLLEELKPVTGTVVVKGRVSYSSQQPWIFSGTLRENILFGLPFKLKWYNKVVTACCLKKDIDMLVDGDLTLVGERGVTLSGGQKARVSLARAIYHDADICLLDDPLSAVDIAVAKHIFSECIEGLLRDRIVVLVTHQVQFALQVNKILALNKEGEVQMYGTYEELSAGDHNDLDEFLGLLTHESETSHEFSYEEEAVEGIGESVQEECAEYSERNFSNNSKKFKRIPELAHDLIASPNIVSSPSVHSLLSVVGTASEHDHMEIQYQSPLEEEKAHGSVSFKTYYYYFRAGGNILVLLVMCGLFFLTEGGIVVSDWWLSDWADCSTENDSARSSCQLSTHQRITTYSSIISAALLMNFARGALLYFVCVNASRVFHNRMFRTILRAPVLFFDTNPSGRILNRFSKDVGFLDDLLPPIFLTFLLLFTRIVAVIATVSASNVYVIPPSFIAVVLFLALRWYYLKTAREVKRLEAISRSPLYSHISTTLQGLTTIRTLGNQNIAMEKLHDYQNKHTQGWYLTLVAQRWLNLRIDTFGALYIACVAFTSVPVASQLNAGLVGLGLAYSMSLVDYLQFCVRQSAEVESIMISTERIMSYGRLESEASLETLSPNQKPLPSWPNKGRITFEDVAFRYSQNSPLVLKNLCFSIQPSEKVGVVGRTGAGKSSLISALYRLAEPFGLITIDGVDTKSIGLHDLRSKVSIIPQDPVLFSGTMRYNMDPFDEYSDAELWEALEQVQLKETIQGLGQLTTEVSETGSNFSVGQRQLVCLARALLRKNKILVLDEATANVDHRTDEIIQKAIREKFSGCTVITIAHRLNTIMDSDKILVMSKGQLQEFDTPFNLLQSPNSLFNKMVEKTGPTASKKLRQMVYNQLMRDRAD